MLKIIDKIPLAPLLFIAVFFAIIPITQSHLVEKIGMLAQGTLVKPIDIFDLFMHGTPSVLVVIKLVRIVMGKTSKQEPEER